MHISKIISALESWAPLSLQEDYDNAGLMLGDPAADCASALVSLDVTEEVVAEAVDRGCNLIIGHHPLIFRGLKKLTGSNGVERAVMLAIKHDISVYSIHTNLDNVIDGVNGRIADLLGLSHRTTLQAKPGQLFKIACFVPEKFANPVLDAMFAAGAGTIGNYSECAYEVSGTGMFKPGEGTNPFSGQVGQRQLEPEVRVETILPQYLLNNVVAAMMAAHPYEEVAYDVYELRNQYRRTGSGLIGTLPQPLSVPDFLQMIKSRFSVASIRHTNTAKREVGRVAVCGGSGSFLIPAALKRGADVFVTADIRYHDFFDTDASMMVCDIGHFESEQFTSDLIIERLRSEFPNFAVLKSETNTNPVRYFI
jgi:dinuclear metal center YbgI/SA1388 family protein